MTRQEKLSDLSRQLQRLREKRRVLRELIREVKLALQSRGEKKIRREGRAGRTATRADERRAKGD